MPWKDQGDDRMNELINHNSICRARLASAGSAEILTNYTKLS